MRKFLTILSYIIVASVFSFCFSEQSKSIPEQSEKRKEVKDTCKRVAINYYGKNSRLIKKVFYDVDSIWSVFNSEKEFVDSLYIKDQSKEQKGVGLFIMPFNYTLSISSKVIKDTLFIHKILGINSSPFDVYKLDKLANKVNFIGDTLVIVLDSFPEYNLVGHANKFTLDNGIFLNQVKLFIKDKRIFWSKFDFSDGRKEEQFLFYAKGCIDSVSVMSFDSANQYIGTKCYSIDK